MSEQFEILICEKLNIYCNYEKEEILLGEKYVITDEGVTYKWDNWKLLQDNNYDSTSDWGY